MTIYIVTDGEYSDYHIEAVFTDKKQAEIYAALHHCNEIEEWDADVVNIEGNVEVCVVHRFHLNKYNYMRYADHYYNDGKITKVVKELDGEFSIYVSLDEYNFEKARKIAQDMFAEYMASNPKRYIL